MAGLAIAGVAVTISVVGSAGDIGVAAGEAAFGDFLAADIAQTVAAVTISRLAWPGRRLGAIGAAMETTDCAAIRNRVACAGAAFGIGALTGDLVGGWIGGVAGFGMKAVAGVSLGSAGRQLTSVAVSRE